MNGMQGNPGRITPVPQEGQSIGVGLRSLGDMGLCEDKRLSGDGDNSFIRPTGRVRGQEPPNFGSDVLSNNGKVAVFKLENIRTALQPRGFRSTRMWVWTKSA